MLSANDVFDMGVTRVAVDFDDTLIKSVTRPEILTVQFLVDNANQDVVKLMRDLFHIDGDIRTGIVTFSSRKDLIGATVRALLGFDVGIESGLPNSIESGKEDHMNRLFGDVAHSKTLLIDDSAHNIDVARAHGRHAWLVDREW